MDPRRCESVISSRDSREPHTLSISWRCRSMNRGGRRERVSDRYLGPDHLGYYYELMKRLVKTPEGLNYTLPCPGDQLTWYRTGT
jgi:hypothetical protein